MRSRDEQIQIANTIIMQLGGCRFKAMTGARNFFATETGLTFRIPGGGGFAKNGINHITINLNSLDLYDMEFKRVRGSSVKTVAERNGIYNDMLQSIFTAETGLNTHL